MNKTAAIALGVGLVAGVGFVALRYYLLDKDEETKVPDLAEDLKKSLAQLRRGEGRVLRERPQRHEDTAADAT